MAGSYRRSYGGPWSGGANGREGMGMSGARGRRGAMRDSMGRYSRDSHIEESRRNDEFAERMKSMAMNLPENFRGEILRMAEEMKRM